MDKLLKLNISKLQILSTQSNNAVEQKRQFRNEMENAVRRVGECRKNVSCVF